jgi:hypothetical protein
MEKFLEMGLDRGNQQTEPFQQIAQSVARRAAQRVRARRGPMTGAPLLYRR